MAIPKRLAADRLHGQAVWYSRTRRVMRGGNGRFLADDLLVGFSSCRRTQEANWIVQVSNGLAEPTELDEEGHVTNGCSHRLA